MAQRRKSMVTAEYTLINNKISQSTTHAPCTLLDDDGFVLPTRSVPALVALEYTRDRIRERLQEDGHLVSREHERLFEELETLDVVRPLHLEVLWNVFDLLDELLLRERFLSRDIFWAGELVAQDEVESCGARTEG